MTRFHKYQNSNGKAQDFVVFINGSHARLFKEIINKRGGFHAVQRRSISPVVGISEV